MSKLTFTPTEFASFNKTKVQYAEDIYIHYITTKSSDKQDISMQPVSLVEGFSQDNNSKASNLFES